MELSCNQFGAAKADNDIKLNIKNTNIVLIFIIHVIFQITNLIVEHTHMIFHDCRKIYILVVDGMDYFV